MPTSSRHRWIALTGFAALSAAAGLFLLWNTNVLGEETFCDDIVSPTEMSSVLDSAGRISEVRSLGKPVTALSCRTERTSRFLGKESMEFEISTEVHEPDFQFQTHTWKNPSDMSFFSNGSTGAVSDQRGWVLLPEACRGKVGMATPGGRQMPEVDEVVTVDAVIKGGATDRSALARMLVAAAHRIAAQAGCVTSGQAEEPQLQARKTAPTDAAAVCGLPGFTLPRQALIEGEAALNTERISGSMPGTWSCGLDLSGNAEGTIWFSASSDPRIVSSTLLNDDRFRDLPGGAGKVDTLRNAHALICGDKTVYFTMRWSDEYWGAVNEPSAALSHEMLQSFIDSARTNYACPAVPLPAP
ncbi:hypothetical protein Q5762_34910 [Streptomyces sp. P9(2023)]|uniref:hypothetical protein n=1 Tax=Streptomyces sp. P9(2023) TaxID=3064394 RepID=UPI0028F3E356|nr:hypothetical protein [Streptomyces sp. P9(2023)]MDT9693428.1 hypothetical protein [Streptomyces sp. P9(2023)]